MHLKVALLAFLVVGCLAAPPPARVDKSEAAVSDPGSKSDDSKAEPAKPDDSKAADASSSSQSGNEGDDTSKIDLSDPLAILIIKSGPLFPFRDFPFGNPFGGLPLPIPYNSFGPGPDIYFGPGPVVAGEDDLLSTNGDAGNANAPSGEETKPKSAENTKPKSGEGN